MVCSNLALLALMAASSIFALPLPSANSDIAKRDTCVTSTLNPISCDSGTSVTVDPDVSPNVNIGRGLETVEERDVCVSSTGNPISCDSGTTINVKPDISPDVNIGRSVVEELEERDTCVSSTLNPVSCDSGTTVNVDPTIDPTVNVDAGGVVDDLTSVL